LFLPKNKKERKKKRKEKEEEEEEESRYLVLVYGEAQIVGLRYFTLLKKCHF
jgi:polynucleotide 5'-kinase involved in rRNA processing